MVILTTEEWVEERKGQEKIFYEIRKKRVDEKKDGKKKKMKRRQKRGKRVWWDFFFKKNYNYTSPQQIKNKIYHSSCGVNVKKNLNLLIKY